MSRVIKFRAWDSRNDEMVYSNDTDCFYVNTKGVLFMYAIPKSESGLETIYHKSYDVDQFTGLTDKNGVDIYEDDVLLVEYNYLGTMAVKFISGAYNIAGYSLDRCQVVGNIHQDPELLLK